MQEKKEEDLQQALNKVFEVGIDEVGRGAIFGPVFAAAVVLTEWLVSNYKVLGIDDNTINNYINNSHFEMQIQGIRNYLTK